MSQLSITRLLSLSIISQALAQRVSFTDSRERPSCTVHPGRTNATDDVPAILEAFEKCGHGGDIIFPANETYHINSRLNPVVNDVNIDWRGEWLVSLLIQVRASKSRHSH
jgi:galacturan 1,4-alpha-galacturonidase